LKLEGGKNKTAVNGATRLIACSPGYINVRLYFPFRWN